MPLTHIVSLDVENVEIQMKNSIPTLLYIADKQASGNSIKKAAADSRKMQGGELQRINKPCYISDKTHLSTYTT